MLKVETKVNTAAIESELRDLAVLVTKGSENGVREAGKLAGALAKAAIPVASGRTAGRLRVTYSRRQGDFVARVGVRAPRAHIMRFIENGTKTHGRYGGPLPARKIMAGIKLIIEPKVPEMIERAIAIELRVRGI